MLPRTLLGSGRVVVVSLAFLLSACANPPTTQQPRATAIAPASESPVTAVALATTAPSTLPSAPTVLPTPSEGITTAPTTRSATAQPTLVPTVAPSPVPASPLPASSAPTAIADRPSAQVVRVVDGDTVDVRLDGRVVRLRLIGIDTPEVVDPRKPVECFGREASAQARALLDGQTVALEADTSQGEVDRYDRLLRYIWLPDGRLFNQEMIAQGYAFEYTYDQPYKYQAEFKQAQQEARDAQRGLWATDACAGEHRPAAAAPAVEPSPAPQPEPTVAPVPPESTAAPPPSPEPSPVPVEQPAPAGNCDPAYPDVCIPPPPPDLDCADIPYRNFRVLPPDPHRFDRDRDGIGCEK